MKSRAQIKKEAMSAFMQKYWPSVGILVLGWVIIWAMSAIPFVGWLLSLLVGVIVAVGISFVSLHISRRWNMGVETLFMPFNRYGRVLGGMLWMSLRIFLWELIAVAAVVIYMAVSMTNISLHYFIGYPGSVFEWWSVIPGLYLVALVASIPAIVVYFSYAMTPFILADSPGVPATDALQLSVKMMRGHKWELFVMVLSFLGWFILSVITFGVLYVFYVGPYWQASLAGFYDEVKRDALQKGIVTLKGDFREYDPNTERYYMAPRPAYQGYSGQPPQDNGWRQSHQPPKQPYQGGGGPQGPGNGNGAD